jgi:hypothetical protein
VLVEGLLNRISGHCQAWVKKYSLTTIVKEVQLIKSAYLRRVGNRKGVEKVRREK